MTNLSNSSILSPVNKCALNNGYIISVYLAIAIYPKHSDIP